MIRELVTPRPNWQEDCEAIGFSYHSIDGTYWDESRCYRFATDEIDALEAAAGELHARCLDAVEHIVSRNRFAALAIPAAWRDRVARSWRAKELSLFGRFDFAYDGSGPPKLLEYNADTPTALLEASVAQWHSLEQKIRPQYPDADQFNSLHEKLIASWCAFAVTWSAGTRVHFTCAADSMEDCGNLDHLRDVATQGGVETRFVAIADIGWDRLLPILWELFPGHPNLLPAFFEPGRMAGDYVEKPLLSREGANVIVHRGGETIAADCEYGEEGRIYQAYAPIARFGDDYATIGAWIVGDAPAGIGLREDAGPITRNTSRFVPHYFL